MIPANSSSGFSLLFIAVNLVKKYSPLVGNEPFKFNLQTVRLCLDLKALDADRQVMPLLLHYWLRPGAREKLG